MNYSPALAGKGGHQVEFGEALYDPTTLKMVSVDTRVGTLLDCNGAGVAVQVGDEKEHYRWSDLEFIRLYVPKSKTKNRRKK